MKDLPIVNASVSLCPAMSKELSKEDLRRPDEFVGFFESNLHQFENRKKQIFTIVVVVLIAFGLFFFIQSKKNGANQAAANDFAKVMEKLPQSFSQSTEDWNGIDTALTEFLKNHPNTSFSPAAYLYKGKAAYSLKKYDEALAAYQNAKNNTSAPYVYLAQEGEAITHMQLEHWDQAKAIWTSLVSRKDNPLKDFHLYNLALIQEQMGNQDEAMATYKRIIEEFPTSTYAETAKIKNPEAAKK